MNSESRFSVIAAVNDDDILAANLAKSPDILSGALELVVERGWSCAGAAYNAGLSKARGEVLVFAHQDVYFPKGWLARIVNEIQYCPPNWAVLGLIGCGVDGVLLGRVWMTLHGEIGRKEARPKPVVSVDELTIILRRDTGMRFDVKLPGFHLYGADIVQSALSDGRGAYVVDAPVVHNTNYVVQLGTAYWSAYRYIQKKWKKSLPLPTPTLLVTRTGWPFLFRFLRAKKHQVFGRKTWPSRADNPEQIAIIYETGGKLNSP